MESISKWFEVENTTLMYCDFDGSRSYGMGPNFIVELDAALAERLQREGWNVKDVPRSSAPHQSVPSIQVTIPKGTQLSASVIGKQVYIRAFGYEWKIGERQGIKAFLIEIRENDGRESGSSRNSEPE